MRKIMCFCDRCAVAADWTMRPWTQDLRYFELAVRCHGETEQFLVAASEFFQARDPSTGRELATPLYVIAFEGEGTSKTVRVIESRPDLSLRIPDWTNRLARE